MRKTKSKPEKRRQETEVRVRMFSREKATLIKAARKDGLPLSTWLRSVALKAARGG